MHHRWTRIQRKRGEAREELPPHLPKTVNDYLVLSQAHGPPRAAAVNSRLDATRSTTIQKSSQRARLVRPCQDRCVKKL